MERLSAPAGIAVRAMRAEDVEAVVGIETQAFTTPWQPDTFVGLLDRPTVELRVLEHESLGVVGYSVLWVVLDQGELANIAVRAEHRGRGWGAHLLRATLDVAVERGVATLYLEVRESNRAALSLYRRFGFAEVGVRRGYYDSPREDARVMMLRL